MKKWNLLVWITQLGISVAVPPAALIWLGVWLRERFDLGAWVVILAVLVGLVFAAEGLVSSLKAMDQMSRDKNEPKPPVSFNNHD